VVMFTVFCLSGSSFLRNHILCWLYVLRLLFMFLISVIDCCNVRGLMVFGYQVFTSYLYLFKSHCSYCLAWTLVSA
jgi:hypothetical protein